MLSGFFVELPRAALRGLVRLNMDLTAPLISRSARRRARVRRTAALFAVIATDELRRLMPGVSSEAVGFPSQCSDQGRSGKGSLDFAFRKQLRTEQLADTRLATIAPPVSEIHIGDAEASASPDRCQALNAVAGVICSMQSAVSGFTHPFDAPAGGTVGDVGWGKDYWCQLCFVNPCLWSK